MMTAKKIVIHSYNPLWPCQFTLQAANIKNLLGSHCLDIHHIGSTSVPGLCAKEDLDILLVVDDLKESLILEQHGYVFKGELNVPLRFYFSLNTSEAKVNLHVCEQGHGFISLNLTFRDSLRASTRLRDTYAALKTELVTDPISHEKTSGRFSGYNLGKDAFIKKTLKEAGFDEYILNFCMHDAEWQTYHQLLNSNEKGAVAHPDTRHFVLYHGTKIIAAAEISMIDDNFILQKWATNLADATQRPYDHFMSLLKKWQITRQALSHRRAYQYQKQS